LPTTFLAKAQTSYPKRQTNCNKKKKYKNNKLIINVVEMNIYYHLIGLKDDFGEREKVENYV
jgi:hypothetical protein